MKKTMKIGVILLALLCVMTQLSGISHAGPTGVAGSMHDMSVYYLSHTFADPTISQFTYDTDEVCVFCHTPHNSNPGMREDTYWDGSAFATNGTAPNVDAIMLWNRSIGNGLTTKIERYKSSSMQATQLDSYKAGEVWTYSLMCLSCHDGVSAINVLHNNPRDYPFAGAIDPGPDNPGITRFGQVDNLPANIGGRVDPSTDTITHLEDDHPISVDYVELYDLNLDLGLNMYSDGYVGDPRVRLFPRPGRADRANNKVAMECSTCHDVHNEGSNEPTAPANVRFKYPFLAVTVAGSYMCRQCHNK